MTKKFCDRCEKEIDEVKIKIRFESHEDIYIVVRKYDKPDLCEECLKKLQEFMKGE